MSEKTQRLIGTTTRDITFSFQAGFRLTIAEAGVRISVAKVLIEYFLPIRLIVQEYQNLDIKAPW
jgi:hypothetical protein